MLSIQTQPDTLHRTVIGDATQPNCSASSGYIDLSTTVREEISMHLDNGNIPTFNVKEEEEEDNQDWDDAGFDLNNMEEEDPSKVIHAEPAAVNSDKAPTGGAQQ
ncbi:hypothetical protein PROFUN_03207 [Planoprotostelium fungivorum]|uniref:Uncharacterized protein n=1 Tax=Planoprotostelium fungivorum TaxID=1890364 RepID=A0A2P6NX04_9EUKA|nr:hypothetical protein PROFUN_03207 [Planoprotostelium fungivorum]